MIKRRGRPPKFNKDEALEKALEVFWSKGLTATSLDDLATAMGMNRPSIYNAFGDKLTIYRSAMAKFAEQLGQKLDNTLIKTTDLKLALEGFYDGALDVYFGNTEPRGCFVTCTAPVEALAHPEIKDDLAAITKHVDNVLEQRLRQAQQDGELALDKDPKVIAQLLHATLQSMSIRARGGASKNTLKKLYLASIEMLC